MAHIVTARNAGLLRSKYRILPILYCQYFFSIGEGITNTFEKVSVEVLPILFWPQKMDTFYQYFFMYYIGYNSLPLFAAVERLFTLGGKIFAPLLTCLSSRHV